VRFFSAESRPTGAAAAGAVRNVDSTARDHLANERTWLAWLRTSVALMALSLPLHELFHAHESIPLQFAGSATLGTSVGVLGFATRRYFRNAALLQSGLFAVNKRGVLALSGVAMSVAVVLSVVLFDSAGSTKSLLAHLKPTKEKEQEKAK
jgi:putative membrane protein